MAACAIEIIGRDVVGVRVRLDILGALCDHLIRLMTLKTLIAFYGPLLAFAMAVLTRQAQPNVTLCSEGLRSFLLGLLAARECRRNASCRYNEKGRGYDK
jgi:hypothetical protein